MILKRWLQAARNAFLAAALTLAGHEPAWAWVNVAADVWDAQTGAHLGRTETHNLVVDAGLNLIRDLMAGDAVGYPTHFAVGTGTADVVAGDTALGAEVYRDVITQREKSAKKLTIRFYLPSTEANGSSITEVGLFNAASLGTLYARALVTAIPKTSAIAVTFTWECTWGAG